MFQYSPDCYSLQKFNAKVGTLLVKEDEYRELWTEKILTDLNLLGAFNCVNTFVKDGLYIGLFVRKGCWNSLWGTEVEPTFFPPTPSIFCPNHSAIAIRFSLYSTEICVVNMTERHAT